MGYLVNERIEVSVYIDDKEYPLDALNILNYLVIGTMFKVDVPTMSMQITDVRHVLDKIGLKDGTPIRVVVKPYGKDSRTYRFRKFNHSRVLGGSSYIWTIHGYWDAPLFWAGSSVRSIQGSTNSVLAEVARTCGLEYDGTTTNDSQLWLPRNRVYRTWAKDIVDHAWVNNTSCMIMGIDLDGILRFKNANALPQPEKKIVAYQLAADAVTAVDVQVSASSGFNNALTGYQNMRVAQSTTADQTTEAIKDLSFTPDSKAPLYNEKLKTSLGRGAVRFSPIDAGNVHLNYERAAYQNLRYKNLFSLGLDVMLVEASDFKLGERVTLSIQNEDTGQDNANAGVYTVSGHSLYIQGANYAEKLAVCRHGTNEVTR